MARLPANSVPSPCRIAASKAVVCGVRRVENGRLLVVRLRSMRRRTLAGAVSPHMRTIHSVGEVFGRPSRGQTMTNMMRGAA